ncbi:MAG: hypothetical protein E7039_07380 [Lentisphaerae bacterium]|nr:hypothetical protein [Lentisphaerota bacterium]
MKRFYGTIFVVLIGVAALPLTAGPRDIGAFNNVRTGAARMPFYKNQQLEYFMRSKSMTLRGKLVDTLWPMIDSVRKGVSVETIAKSDNSEEVYALNSPLETVLDFWKRRAYSAGVVVSESATFDQSQRVASGTQKVFMRSPSMDLNGVGFSADFGNHQIKINSNVEIVMRNEGGRSATAPLAALATDKKTKVKKSGTTITRAFCDELHIDTERNFITLLGNVRVFDAAGTITSERLEIEFGDEPAPKDGKKAQVRKDKTAKDKKSASPTDKKQNLRIARFIGKVHAVRKLDPAEAAEGEQTADADLLVYNAKTDTIELTGSRPRLARGRDTAEAERIVLLANKRIVRFFDKCFFKFHRSKEKNASPDLVNSDYADWNYPEDLIRLIGNAKFRSPADKSELQADRIEITLADKPAGKSTGGKEKSSNGKRPEKSVANGNVRFVRNNNGVEESARAGRMTYQANQELIHMENKPVVQRGGDIIRGGEMTYHIAKERMVVERSSHITLSGATVDKNNSGQKSEKTAAAEPVTVDSRSADLNYGGNKLAFAGNVAVRGRGMKLDSDKLDIDLKNAPETPGRKPAEKSDVKTRKQPVRALAVGNVHAEDESGILDSGVLDVRFGNTGTAGKTEIEKIYASNKLHLQSKPDKGGSKKSNGNTLLGKSADGTTTLEAERGVMNMLTNVADFYEKVVVKDNAVKLECEHLQLIAAKTDKAVPSIASFRARDEFPDRLAAGDGRELLKVIANDKVNIFRTLPTGEIQRARGDQGIYTVKERKMVLTCEPPRRPQALTADSGMVGDKVTIELDTEDVYVENGDVLTRMNDLNF